jgi:iron complex transport system permease protein
MLGADALCRSVSGSVDLRPGVVMALLGGPFFLALMIRQARARIPS